MQLIRGCTSFGESNVLTVNILVPWARFVLNRRVAFLCVARCKLTRRGIVAGPIGSLLNTGTGPYHSAFCQHDADTFAYTPPTLPQPVALKTDDTAADNSTGATTGHSNRTVSGARLVPTAGRVGAALLAAAPDVHRVGNQA